MVRAFLSIEADSIQFMNLNSKERNTFESFFESAQRGPYVEKST